MLIACPHCDNQVSSKALICPKCNQENFSEKEISMFNAAVETAISESGNYFDIFLNKIKNKYIAALIGAFLGKILARIPSSMFGGYEDLVALICLVGLGYFFYRSKERLDEQKAFIFEGIKANYASIRSDDRIAEDAFREIRGENAG